MSDTVPVEKKERPPGRLRLLHDTVMFQIKLALDGLGDLLLVPVSLVGAVVSFITGNRAFYDVVHAGLIFERRLNLFGAVRDAGVGEDDRIEALARRLEAQLLDEYRNGRLQASARAALERIINGVRKPRGE